MCKLISPLPVHLLYLSSGHLIVHLVSLSSFQLLIHFLIRSFIRSCRHSFTIDSSIHSHIQSFIDSFISYYNVLRGAWATHRAIQPCNCNVCQKLELCQHCIYPKSCAMLCRTAQQQSSRRYPTPVQQLWPQLSPSSARPRRQSSRAARYSACSICAVPYDLCFGSQAVVSCKRAAICVVLTTIQWSTPLCS